MVWGCLLAVKIKKKNGSLYYCNWIGPDSSKTVRCPWICIWLLVSLNGSCTELQTAIDQGIHLSLLSETRIFGKSRALVPRLRIEEAQFNSGVALWASFQVLGSGSTLLSNKFEYKSGESLWEYYWGPRMKKYQSLWVKIEFVMRKVESLDFSLWYFLLGFNLRKVGGYFSSTVWGLLAWYINLERLEEFEKIQYCNLLCQMSGCQLGRRDRPGVWRVHDTGATSTPRWI